MNMQQHLDAGCSPCQSTEAWLRALGQFWRAEPANTPPPRAVRFALGSFAWARPLPGQPAGKLRLANLLGGLQPQAAGLRAGAGLPRHAAYRAGGWVVDVCLEPAAPEAGQPARHHLLSGQILHAADPLRRIPDAPVSARVGEQVLAVTVTNEHGEFQLRLPLAATADSHLEIHLSGENNRRVHNGPGEETLIIPLRILEGRSPALGDASRSAGFPPASSASGDWQ